MFEHSWFDMKVVLQSCYKSLEEIYVFGVDMIFLRARIGAEWYVSFHKSTQQACPQGVVVVVVVVAPVVPRV